MKRCIILLTILLLSTGVMAQNVIQVAAGNGTLSAAYSAAQPGDILELITDGGLYDEPNRLTIDKPLTIRAAAGLAQKPVWTSREANYVIKLVASLTVKGIVFDGAQGGAKTTGAIDFRLTAGSVFLVDCDFINMSKSSGGSDGRAIYITAAAHLDSLVINNCTFQKIAKHGILAEANPTVPGSVKFLSIENSTFWQIGIEAVYIDDPDDDLSTPGPLVVINHSTFHDTKRILTHKADYNVIHNTIFTNSAAVGNDSYYIYGDNSYVRNSLYFNAGINMHTGKAINMLTVDPMYKDAVNGDFTLDPHSPAVNFGDDGKSIGDPRWWPKLVTGTPVEAGIGQIAAAYATANPGDVLELVSDGGLYQEPTRLDITKPVIIRTASFVMNKPTWVCDNAAYIIKAGADFAVDNIIFDGAKGAALSTGAIMIGTTNFTALKITNCDFNNFTDPARTTGRAINDNDTAAQIDSVIISNCTFTNIAKEAVRFGSHAVPALGSAKYFLVENSTFWKITSDAIYVRDHDGIDGTPGPIFIVNHCTFFDASATYGVLAHHIDGAIIKNCVAAHSTNAGKTTYYIYGDASILKNSLYFNLGINTHTSQKVNVINADPLFIDAANGNFMVYKNSPAVNAGDDGITIGDPRWGVSTIDLSVLAVVKNPYSMSPTTNSVRIVWETPLNGSKASVVQYGATSALGNTITGPDGWLIDGEGYLHEVELTGLAPYTIYYYRAGNGPAFSEINKTKTAPLAGTNFRIMVGGDSRDNPPLWEEICGSALADSVDMWVHVGDYVTSSVDRSDWGPEFLGPAEVLNNERPFIGTIGNHETADGPPYPYYDYMALPTHPENGERPESYFAMPYGNVTFVVVNSNGNFGASQNEEYAAGSLQYAWLDNELANCTTAWIFIVQHTPVLSTSLHGQWTGGEKEFLMPLYEKYAKMGKHIVVFNGDDHNFEHLYKDGVNHFRPAGGGAPLYNNGLNTADAPWSVYFNMTHNYATIDVRANGDTVIVRALYPDGKIFYETTLTKGGNQRPNIYLIEPDGKGDEVMDNYRITWADSDPDNDALVDLYYTPDKSGNNNTLIVSGIHEDSTLNAYVWDVSKVTPGAYYIYAVINDGVNPPFGRYSNGVITVIADNIAPPPITMMAAVVVSPRAVKLSWTNPTGIVNVDHEVADFDSTVDGFVGEAWAVGDKGSLELVPGVVGKAMRINYTIGSAWSQYGAFRYYSNYPNWAAYDTLDFWYRGDGSSRAIRLIVCQDNDRNGAKDDQWYTEACNLSSTTWKHAKIPVQSLQDLGWDIDIDKEFDQQNIFSLEFVIPSPAPASGTCEIDEIVLRGQVPAAADYKGTVVLRRTDRFPADAADGVEVYRGIASSCIDSSVVLLHKYYYAAFAFDEVPNYSALETTSVVDYAHGATDVGQNQTMLPMIYRLDQNYPNPFNPSTVISYAVPQRCHVKLVVFNMIGQVVAELYDGMKEAGFYTTTWRPEVSNGIYYYHLQATPIDDTGKSFSETRKMVFLK